MYVRFAVMSRPRASAVGPGNDWSKLLTRMSREKWLVVPQQSSKTLCGMLAPPHWHHTSQFSLLGQSTKKQGPAGFLRGRPRRTLEPDILRENGGVKNAAAQRARASTETEGRTLRQIWYAGGSHSERASAAARGRSAKSSGAASVLLGAEEGARWENRCLAEI